MPMSRRLLASPRFVVATVVAALVLIVGLSQATPAFAQTAGTSTAGTGAGNQAAATRPAGVTTAASATVARPVATGVGGAVATATRPAATAVPVSMPRAGGGGLAKAYVDEDSGGANRGLWFGLLGAVAVVAAGGWYALRLRQR